ncbi:hypothetical protein NM208_g6198 [Fusarium decemcellulare]|uniref:Uncharacterized protein n=1 Tax=Fusarium decemcellulare TaxID=57161 RepID=A0ACC1SE22_9HYPO|nr:hypothetical protein NM208_g6198 [Fusarium decemcellulare]
MSNQILGQLKSQGWTVDQPEIGSNSIAAEAFKKALMQAQSTFKNKESTKWQSDAGIEGVLQSLKDSQRKYHRHGDSKVFKWATRLSSKIMFYGQVLDVLVQHHPEYVSLVWGAFKFLLMGVLNYETLVKELCKALCRIADALRHVQVNLLLYPTEAMQGHIERLYAQIIEFTIRAMKWYEKHPVLRAISALGSPFQLKFRDIVDDILETSRCIDRLALSMSQVEVRQMRLELGETRRVAEEIKASLEKYSQLHYSGLIDTNRKISEVQFSQILTFMSDSVLPDPFTMRQYYASRRNRRRRIDAGKNQLSLDSTQLQQWGARTESSQLLVQGSFKSRHLTRDFAIDMIDLIVDAGVPVAWALDPDRQPGTAFTSMDVLKYVASQVLKLNHTMLNERSASLNAARFQSISTEAEWFSLLGAVLEGLQQIYLVIDLELLNRAVTPEVSWLTEFPRLFESLVARNIRTVVKVAFSFDQGTKAYERVKVWKEDRSPQSGKAVSSASTGE